MDVKTIMVVGAGQMGSGIAQVCAVAGYDVLLYDISEAQLDKGIANIEKLLARQVEKGKMAARTRTRRCRGFPVPPTCMMPPTLTLSSKPLSKTWM